MAQALPPQRLCERGHALRELARPDGERLPDALEVVADSSAELLDKLRDVRAGVCSGAAAEDGAGGGEGRGTRGRARWDDAPPRFE